MRLTRVRALSAVAALGLTATGIGVATTATAAPAAPAVHQGAERPEEGIVGGGQARDGAWPMAVKLRIRTDQGIFGCGGTLISPDTVLTAQHCLDMPSGSVTVDAYVGAVDWKQGEHHTLTAWTTGAGPKKGDWAVARLDTPATGTTFATLAGDGSLDASPTYTAIGWGLTAEGGKGSQLLQQVDLERTKGSDCARTAGTELCTGGNGTAGKDTCNGDSGGPLFAAGPDGRPVQVGITSWGIGCARAHFAGHYTKVSAFLNAILAGVDAVGGTRPGA